MNNFSICFFTGLFSQSPRGSASGTKKDGEARDIIVSPALCYSLPRLAERLPFGLWEQAGEGGGISITTVQKKTGREGHIMRFSAIS